MAEGNYQQLMQVAFRDAGLEAFWNGLDGPAQLNSLRGIRMSAAAFSVDFETMLQKTVESIARKRPELVRRR